MKAWMFTFAALALALSGPALAKDEPFQIISVDDAARLLGQPGVLFLDANTKDTFAQGRVPGAKFVGHMEDAAPLPSDRKDAKLIFYCKNPK